MKYEFNITGKLRDIYSILPDDEAVILRRRFTDGSSANWLAGVLTKHGYPISATTIKEQRRRNRIGA